MPTIFLQVALNGDAIHPATPRTPAAIAEAARAAADAGAQSVHVHAFDDAGRETLEGAAGVTLFTDNDNFYGGNTRAQDPLYSVQGHVIYSFRNGVWASGDATWFGGGRTTLNGALSNDLQQNSRVGATLAFPVDRYNSIKIAASSGVSARTGNSFDLIALAWQHRWGDGL